MLINKNKRHFTRPLDGTGNTRGAKYKSKTTIAMIIYDFIKSKKLIKTPYLFFQESLRNDTFLL